MKIFYLDDKKIQIRFTLNDKHMYVTMVYVNEDWKTVAVAQEV